MRVLSLALLPFLVLTTGCKDAESGDSAEDVFGKFYEISPPEGAQGTSMDVVITADSSTFEFGNTSVDFGPGIIVNSVTVQDAWTVVADITIEPSTETGKHPVTVKVGNREAEAGNFRVVAESFALTPARGKIGETVDLTVEGRGTHWKDGRTWINFGEGVDVLGFTVLAETLAEVSISIDPDAPPGTRDVYTEDGGKIVTLYDGFQVDRVALAGAFEPSIGEQGQTVEFTIYGRGTSFQPDLTEIAFYDGDGLNTDVRVTEINVLDAENLYGKMQISNGADLGWRDAVITTGDEGVRIEDAFEVINGDFGLDEVAVSLTFNVVRAIDNETGEIAERVSAQCIFYMPLDPACPSGGGSGSAPSTDPYDINAVGPIIGSGSSGSDDCPNPTTFSAGDYVWLESDANVVTLEKEVDGATGMIYYVGKNLTMADYVPDNLYDLHLQGDPEGLAEELIEGVQPTVPCDWSMISPQFWGNYTHDRTTDFTYLWTPACTYPDAIFVTNISGTNYAGTDYPGVAMSYPWDDGEHTYTASEMIQLDPGAAVFTAYSYIQGREFGLRDSIYQENVADSYIYLQASFILE